MKRLALTVLLMAMVLCFAQTTGSLTVTIPSDVAADLTHAHTSQYAENKSHAAKFGQTLDDNIAPSTVQKMLQADIATIIADKVQRYSPADLPAKQTGESDVSQRNRYQAQVKSKITVR